MAGYINGSVGRNGSRFTYRIYWEEINVNNSANTSQVRATIQIVSSGSSLWASRSAAATHTITINGKAYGCSSGAYKLQGGTTVNIASVTSDAIAHDGNGSKTVSISASSPDLAQGSGYGPYSGSASGNATLTTIPRYANLTALSLKSRTINTLTFSFTADRSCSIYAKITSPISTSWLNGGQPFKTNVTSGDFTISYKDVNNTAGNLLDPNTNYTFTILCRAQASGLDTSKNVSGQTYDIARITSAPNFNDEQNPTINYSNSFGNNVTSLQACISLTGAKDDIAYRDISKTGTSYTFSLSEAERKLLRQNCPGDSRSVIFYVRTVYNGKTYHSTLTRTMSLVNANPTINAGSITFKDTNSKITELTGSNQILINGYSNVSVTIAGNTAQAKKEAAIKSYNLTIGNAVANTLGQSGSAQTFNTINGVTSGTITVTATDTRNKAVTATKNADIRNYYRPVITSMGATRSNNGVGEEVTLNFSGTWWNANFGSDATTANQLTQIQYYYKKTNSGDFQTGTTKITSTINGNNFSGSIKIKGDTGDDNNFSVGSSYYIKLVATDRLSNSTEYQITLGTGAPALALCNNRVAIGQKYDVSEGSILQVAGDVNMIPPSGKSVVYLKMLGKRIVAADSTNSALSANGGNIYLNPNGDGNGSGQVRIDTGGIIHATSLGSRGNITAQTGATKPSHGLSMYNAYNNGYPNTYGNVLNLQGGGASQLFLGWQGNSTVGQIFYRSMRDYTGDGTVWSPWASIPESRDQSVRWFRAGTKATWNSNYSSYSNGTVMFCW